MRVSMDAVVGENTIIQRNTEVDRFCNIGSNNYIGKDCSLTKTYIGNYCSIGNKVSIGQGEHDLTMISTSSLFYENPYEELTKKDCVIGNDVWIGTDCVILRGVKIGNGAVIGANSVVTKDVPAYAVVVGAPARIIKFRFDEDRIDKIEDSCWWQYNVDEARVIIESL